MTLAVHPELVAVQARVAALRSEIARVLVAIDYERDQHAPYLLARYATTIGRWELSLLEARWRYQRWRRLVEEAQGALARKTTFDRAEAESALDREMVAFREEITWKADEVRRAAWVKVAPTEDDREREETARASYRRLVLRLHPDLIGTPTEDQRRFLQRAHEAYARRDVEELRDLEAALGTNEEAPPERTSLAQWEEREKALRSLLDAHLAKLEAIGQVLPFSLAEKLHDEAYLDERMRTSTAEAADLDRRSAELEALLTTLVMAHHRRDGRPSRPA